MAGSGWPRHSVRGGHGRLHSAWLAINAASRNLAGSARALNIGAIRAGVAYGLDMTDEMVVLAERNRAEAGVDNARFVRGTIEHIPLPDAVVDVVISNCVINLSTDKDAVLAEAFRVLRPGGRFAVSDIVLLRPLVSRWVSVVGL